jgi:plasmid maintenance system antidote protein VapI
MTRTEIAEKLKVSVPLVSQILRGNRRVSRDVATRLTEEFGRDFSFWMLADVNQLKDALKVNTKGGE